MNPLPSLDTGAGPSSIGGGPHSRPGAVVTSSKRGAHTGKVEAEVGSEPRCPLRPHSPSEPPSPHLQCARHAETPHTGPGGKGRAGRESACESSLYGHRVLGEWTCAVRLTQNTSLKLMSLVCFLFFLMQRQGNFTPGLWLRPGAVALGGWGRRAQRRRGRWARLCLCRAERPGGGTGVWGHSQDTASSARGALPAEGRDHAEPPPGPQHPLLGGPWFPCLDSAPSLPVPASRPPGPPARPLGPLPTGPT